MFLNILFMSLIVFLLLTFIFSFFNIIFFEKMQKFSLFECGYSKLKESKNKFSNQFFLISILFLIFDLEIMILIPFLLESSLFMMQNLMLMIFIFLIMYFLIIEWVQGMIEWSK